MIPASAIIQLQFTNLKLNIKAFFEIAPDKNLKKSLDVNTKNVYKCDSPLFQFGFMTLINLQTLNYTGIRREGSGH